MTRKASKTGSLVVVGTGIRTVGHLTMEALAWMQRADEIIHLVADPVAEALIATAAALSVAIPAVFGYNIFAHRLNRFDGELDTFGSELVALMVREGRI